MTSTPVVDPAVDTSRPRPNPGYRVAPPVADAYAPWVSALDDDLAPGQYEWTMLDGALVPVPLTEDAVEIRPKQRWWARRPHLLR